MAQPTTTQTRVRQAQPDPVLRPGRPADPPVPAAKTALNKADDGTEPDNGAASRSLSVEERIPAPEKPDAGAEEGEDQPAPGQEVHAAPGDESEQVEQRYAESRQRRLRRLLRQCERVTLLDFNVLSLSGWPDNFSLSLARRRRDLWVLSATVAALVFLSGLTGFVPAWIAGGGFGAFVVILFTGLPLVRRLYSSKPSHLELVMYRHQLMQDARRHVAHLEGSVGLIWQCNELSEFNPALAAPRFGVIKHLSEQRRLAGSLTKREHIRLYLIFMLEAEKAYEHLQAAYFQGHQEAIDRGWRSVADSGLGPDRPDTDPRMNAGDAAIGSANEHTDGQGADGAGADAGTGADVH